jgi:hypothetical protein
LKELLQSRLPVAAQKMGPVGTGQNLLRDLCDDLRPGRFFSAN